MSSQKLDVGQAWIVRQAQFAVPPQELIVLTLTLGPAYDKGYREVECLLLEGPRAGCTVTLSNGAFNAPNKRIA